MAKERNWKLREDRADYFGTVREPVMTLNLDITRQSGVVDRVGRFVLDLEDLAARGFVNRNIEDGEPEFVVQINHVHGRDFNLGVRVGETTPLAPFAVR
jgi:hypothetical protein